MLDLLISPAYAEGAAAQEPSLLGSLLPLILLFVVFYFLLIRPQQKKAKEHRNLVQGLAKGDEVVTLGGVCGRVVAVETSFIDLEIAANTIVKIQRDHVSQLLPKGSLKGKTEVAAEKTDAA